LTEKSLLTPLSVPGARYITSYDPSTGLHLGTFKADTEDEIAHKIMLAARAQQGQPADYNVPARPGWRGTTFAQRRKVVRSLKKWLVDNQEVIARVACRDTGKTCAFETTTYVILLG
jgi:acyl-CoA reductase-like NAD-dependent aldehyde dehydrogenase